MDSVPDLRAEALASRDGELTAALRSRKRKLQELYAVSRHIERSKPFPAAIVIERWDALEDTGASLEDSERKFLDDNDLLKGRFFNETSLPSYSQLYAGPPPEPGGLKTLPIRAPTPALHPPPVPAPEHSPAKRSPVESPKPIPSDTAPPPTLKPIPSRTRHPLPQKPPLPVPREPSSPRPVLETTPNGQAREVPASPTPPPPPQPFAPAPPDKDERAPVAGILGVPVIQQATTRAPDEREAQAGVHPPPPPSPLSAPSVESLSPTEPETEAPASGQERSTPPLEVPDSQPSPTQTSPIPEAGLPAGPTRQSQPTLSVSTDNSPATPKKSQLQHPEASSPTSSVGDAQSTPGNAVLSSATSPDTAHISSKGDEQDAANKVPPVDESNVILEGAVKGSVSASVEPPSTPKPKLEEQRPAPSTPKGPATEPTSPDPSAQLRLEVQLAKDRTPVPGERSPLESLEPASAKAKSTPKQLPALPERENTPEESEDEDEVDLVRSTAPSTIPSPSRQVSVERHSVEDIEKVEEETGKAAPPAVTEQLPKEPTPAPTPITQPESAAVTWKPLEVDVDQDVIMEDTEVGEPLNKGLVAPTNKDSRENEAEQPPKSDAQPPEETNLPDETLPDELVVEESATEPTKEPIVSQSRRIKPAAKSIQEAAPGYLSEPPSHAKPHRREKRPPKPILAKVVISSAHHAEAAAEAEMKRLREDQEQQGPIVVARRRTQHAATVAARGRLFPPGSRLDALTKYGVDENKEEKKMEMFDTLYMVGSMQMSTNELIKRSSKSITTNYHDVHHFDSQAVRTLKRIQELQTQGRWCLTQIEKAPEPPQRKVHWDYLLEEMKWLREDFHEERKWKIAVARQVAHWVMEWHQTSPEERCNLLVDPKPAKSKTKRNSLVSNASSIRADASTPDLVDVDSPQTPDEDQHMEDLVKQEVSDDVVVTLHGNEDPQHHGKSPAEIFTLSADSTMFEVPMQSKEAKKLFDTFPLFGPPQPPPPGIKLFVDDSRKRVVPTSKFALGTVELECLEPPRKRSRYDYEINKELFADDSEDEGDIVDGEDRYGRPLDRDKSMRPIPLLPEQANVALFKSEFKPTLQRVRSRVFRPPTDMPPAPFFECRNPSLWTPEEDEQLRSVAKEYGHNWNLVATYMELPSEYHPGSERRSPWECFERWVSLESMPQDFQKTSYHKPVQSRLDLAARASAKYKQAAETGQLVNVHKRKGTAPQRVDRRRNTRQFALFDAMKKMAKKREVSANKAQQSGRSAQMAMRKQQDAPASVTSNRTPQYFSQLKHDKELKSKAIEKERLLQQMRAQQTNRIPNGVHIASQARAPVPNQTSPVANHSLPNGIPSNGRSPHQIQQATMQMPGQPISQVPTSTRQLSPQEIQQQLRIRSVQIAQQQAVFQRQTQLLQQNSNPQVQAILASAQQAALGNGVANPSLSSNAQPMQASAHQLAAYHAQLASSMSSRNPAMVRSQQPNPAVSPTRPGSSAGGTGVLIGANGPIGPGASTVQQSPPGQGSRGGTPMANSPRLPSQPHQQVQIGSPQITQQASPTQGQGQGQGSPPIG